MRFYQKVGQSQRNFATFRYKERGREREKQQVYCELSWILIGLRQQDIININYVRF